MVTARTPQEQLVLDFFRILSSGDLEAIRATLHPDATWRPMVEGVPGAGVHGPRDKIVDEFLAPVRGLFVAGDPKTTVDRMVSTGDTVMCESRGSGNAARRSSVQQSLRLEHRRAGRQRSLPSASTWTVTTSRPCSAAAPDTASVKPSGGSDGFDYVIAGAGTAGCVLANRLSAEAGVTVALIEAGPPDDDPAIRVPAMVAKAIGNPRQSWGYQTVPQRHVDNRVLPVPRGRVLGGCSSINGMVYFRGHPREYDEWLQPGWRYADLLPYFQRLENYEAAHTPQRARGGPVNVHRYPKSESSGAALPRGRRFARPAALCRFQRRRSGGIRPASGDDSQRAARVRRHGISQPRATSVKSQDRDRRAGHPRVVRRQARNGLGDRAGRRAQCRTGPARGASLPAVPTARRNCCSSQASAMPRPCNPWG